MSNIKNLIKLAGSFERKIKFAQSENAFQLGKDAGIKFVESNDIEGEVKTSLNEERIKSMVLGRVNALLDQNMEDNSLELSKAAALKVYSPEEEIKHRRNLHRQLGRGVSQSEVEFYDTEMRTRGLSGSRDKAFKNKLFLTVLAGTIAAMVDHFASLAMYGSLDSAVGKSLELRNLLKEYIIRLLVSRQYQNDIAQPLSEFWPLFLAGFVCGVLFALKKKEDSQISRSVQESWKQDSTYPNFHDHDFGNEPSEDQETWAGGLVPRGASGAVTGRRCRSK